MCRNTRVKCYQEKTHISSHTFLQNIKSTTHMLPLNYKYTYYVPLMTPKKMQIYIQYTYIVGKYKIYLYEL
jgi:hypothetical protein